MLMRCLPRCLPRNRLPTVRVYAVVSEQMSDEALELFVDRQMAELMVENWARDEPDRAGELHADPSSLRRRRTRISTYGREKPGTADRHAATHRPSPHRERDG